MTITWRWAQWSELSRDELYALARLRQDVFVVEQACPYPDLDGQDPAAHHLLGWADGQLACVARVFAPDRCGACRVGRVVVASAHRHRGLGTALMEQAHREIARLYGPVAVVLGGQAHLRGFYESLGYRVDGPGYDEDGIPHLPMRRSITGSHRSE